MVEYMPRDSESECHDRESDSHLSTRLYQTHEDQTERALLVSLATADRSAREVEDSLRELRELAATAGAEVMDALVQKRESPDPSFFIGRGKAEELSRLGEQLQCDVAILDHELTPMQRRNLEDVTGMKVIDRTELILDIFALRAHSYEGKLQVELAQLEYRLPRLAGSGTALSRLGGGIGTRGPGETKLETDRRAIRRRIAELKRGLEDLRRQRRIRRGLRDKSHISVVALCGYTNAGKSSILDLLVRIDSVDTDRFVSADLDKRMELLAQARGAGVLIEDRLFATLDPTVRRVTLPGGMELLVSDTVGFIQRIPHELIAAFRATLEEVREADLLLHVVDASDDRMDAKMEEWSRTLEEIGASNVPVIRVLNKIDRLSPNDRQRLARDQEAVLMSAATAENVELLFSRIEAYLNRRRTTATFLIPYRDGGIESAIRERGSVASAEYTEDGVLIEASVDYEMLNRYRDYIVVREG
jgi:GTP-binding protein HflX